MLHDDSICAVTIDLTPVYTDLAVSRRCRKQFLDGEDVSPSFRAELGRTGSDALMAILRSHKVVSLLTFQVRSEITLCKFDEEDDIRDVFCVEMNVLGEPYLDYWIAPIVANMETADELCRQLRMVAENYSKKHIGGKVIAWEIEASGYED